MSHSPKRQAADARSRKKKGATSVIENTVASPAPTPITITARSPNQKHYMKLLDGEADIVLGDGPAGTGKTYLAVLWAIRQFRAGHFKKIIITRPNVAAGDDLGFLPGDKNQKMEPWMMPIIDVFEEVYTPAAFQMMLERKEVVIEPLAYMRGRTFKNAIILGDEMQNTTPEQMKMFLTRIGAGSRIICTGDLEQHDRGYGKSGLEYAISRFERFPSDRIEMISFDETDVQRHEVIKDVLHSMSGD